MVKKFKIPLIGTYHTLVSEQMSYVSPMNILGINWLISKITKKDRSTVKFLKKVLKYRGKNLFFLLLKEGRFYERLENDFENYLKSNIFIKVNPFRSTNDIRC